MALVRSRMLYGSEDLSLRWSECLGSVVYGYPWDETALDSIRHLKKRIENEKSKETKSHVDFKYGEGGIADMEFLVQFLQVVHGGRCPEVRVPGLQDAVVALSEAGVLAEKEKDTLLDAHRFERLVENRYQLMEEWTSREISHKSPLLSRLAGGLGYRGEPDAVRKSFLSDWRESAGSVRALVDKYFYSKP